MSMQIKSIILYNANGRIRQIDFRLGHVNIVSGRFYTGKSAILPIIEYCLGNDEFEIPDGVIHQYVAWYGVLYQVNDHEIFVAKPKPSGNNQRQSQAHLEYSTASIIIPTFGQLNARFSNGDVRSTISRLLREGMNDNIQEEYLSQEYLRTSLEYTLFYLFQRSNVIMNPDILFHRQQEQGIQQTIRDTILYFLDVVRERDLLKRRDYDQAANELRTLRRKLREGEERVVEKNNAEVGLLKQAQEVGIASTEINVSDSNAVNSALKNALQWEPTLIPEEINDLLPQIREEIGELRREFSRIQEELDATNLFIREAEGYSHEVNEQLMRLESIEIFEKPDDMFSGLCPLCYNSLLQSTPQVEAIRHSLRKLNDDLQYVRREQPSLQGHRQSLLEERERVRNLITEKQSSIRILIDDQTETQEVIQQVVSTNTRIGHITGRISYYMETSSSFSELDNLRQQVATLQERVNTLKQESDEEETEDARERIFNLLGRQMTNWATEMELAYTGLYRLDLKKLTIVVDTEEKSVSMKQMGGNQSVLWCHLLALLALHKYFREHNRPVPSFIILDQPAQGIFPSEDAYKDIEGKFIEINESRTDIGAVKRMFSFLFDICRDLSPDFQIIVLEHANLNDKQFQNALVEKPWTSDNALIPKEWILENFHNQQLNLL